MGEWRQQAYQDDCDPKVSDSASISCNDLRPLAKSTGTLCPVRKDHPLRVRRFPRYSLE